MRLSLPHWLSSIDWKAVENRIRQTLAPSPGGVEWITNSKADSRCDRIAGQLFSSANTYRVSSGLNPLSWNTKLRTAAERHACNMTVSGEFGHVLSDGVDMGQRAERCGFKYACVRENIAWLQDSSLSLDGFARDFHDMWVASPPHRESLLATDITHLGVAVVCRECCRRRYYAVQLFGRPRYPAFERN